MKTLLFSFLLSAATAAFAALTPATDGRLTDYQTWFDGFAVASDANYTATPHPPSTGPGSTPAAGSTPDRDWSGWFPNWGATSLSPLGPLTNTSVDRLLRVEVVFLGETAGWWDDWGFRRGGIDYLLADGVQASSPANSWFGDYTTISLLPGETIDFFVTGTGIFGPNPGYTPSGATGGRYYAFDTTLNLPATATMQSYWGTIVPLTSVREPDIAMIEGPFTVFGFEDIQSSVSDVDYNDFLFAVRASLDLPQGGVPEPSTYGLFAVVVLLALAEFRRRKT